MKELEMIADWERKSDLVSKDPWPAFLRAAVLARADYMEDAVTFFTESQKGGLVKGFEPHYRM